MLGGLMMIASIGLLIAFTAGCILWVLTVISEQIEDWGAVASMPVVHRSANPALLKTESLENEVASRPEIVA
jgi:hypothetical protein